MKLQNAAEVNHIIPHYRQNQKAPRDDLHKITGFIQKMIQANEIEEKYASK